MSPPSSLVQGRHFTLRGVVAGLTVGTVICAANVYFGLQTGWVSIMSMPASLMGYGIFRALRPYLYFPFSPVENVFLQSVAGGMAIMPLGCGFVGVENVSSHEAVDDARPDTSNSLDWASDIRLLVVCFVVSGAFTIATYFFPILRNIPIFGMVAADKWLWTLNPSLAYVGQGVIMGTETTLHMVLGSLIGWAFLSPLAKHKGWAPGPVDDWEHGSKGWIIWVSLAIMLVDAVVSLGYLGIRSILLSDLLNFKGYLKHRLRSQGYFGKYLLGGLHHRYALLQAEEEDDASTRSDDVEDRVIHVHDNVYGDASGDASGDAPEDAPPEQLGALQAGDLMQDLKTGHLLGAAPNAQFWGQVIGATAGAILSAFIYRIYTSVYTIPGDLFQVPTAYVWIFTARLVTGQGLPYMVKEWAVAAASVFAVTTLIRTIAVDRWWRSCVPGGIAVAVGMYNVPSFTLARAIGGIVCWYWITVLKRSNTRLIILASGFILGEGFLSIVNLVLQGLKVPHL
ncbi:hypothetical protein E4U55_001363 [Claviceps digitariae]|nr:hypothetical protein E4U55_001363 [Claviceps digitariae]